jgi:hypothetical protein
MLTEIAGLEVTEIEPDYIEPEAIINLEAIYQEKLARRPNPNPCEACEAYEKILDALLK